jgi:hypothetical protein
MEKLGQLAREVNELFVIPASTDRLLHRRGIIDRRYLEVSGEQQPIGSRLALRPVELKIYLDVVTNAARALISAAFHLASEK